MDKNVLDYVVEKTNDLMGAPSCSGEAKAAAQAWLDAVGTDREAEETRKYVEELEADIMPIDGLIGFAESEHGAQVFGADKAKAVAAHAEQSTVIVRPVRPRRQFWIRRKHFWARRNEETEYLTGHRSVMAGAFYHMNNTGLESELYGA